MRHLTGVGLQRDHILLPPLQFVLAPSRLQDIVDSQISLLPNIIVALNYYVYQYYLIAVLAVYQTVFIYRCRYPYSPELGSVDYRPFWLQYCWFRTYSISELYSKTVLLDYRIINSRTVNDWTVNCRPFRDGTLEHFFESCTFSITVKNWSENVWSQGIKTSLSLNNQNLTLNYAETQVRTRVRQEQLWGREFITHQPQYYYIVIEELIRYSRPGLSLWAPTRVVEAVLKCINTITVHCCYTIQHR